MFVRIDLIYYLCGPVRGKVLSQIGIVDQARLDLFDPSSGKGIGERIVFHLPKPSSGAALRELAPHRKNLFARGFGDIENLPTFAPRFRGTSRSDATEVVEMLKVFGRSESITYLCSRFRKNVL